MSIWVALLLGMGVLLVVLLFHFDLKKRHRRLREGFEAYSELAGKLVVNLQALEFLLRRYLYSKADPPHAPLVAQLNDAKVGDEVPVNALTDYTTFGQLIDRYNKIVSASHPERVIDKSVVDLRDGLAHGRVWLPDGTNAPPILIKFEKPSNSIAKVTLIQVLSSRWLEERLSRVADEIKKVDASRRGP